MVWSRVLGYEGNLGFYYTKATGRTVNGSQVAFHVLALPSQSYNCTQAETQKIKIPW
jgi:hypothetical protein